MSTTRRGDDELAAWLEMVHSEQTSEALDQMADLWLANDDAKAIKDVRCPAYAVAHAKIDLVLTAMGL